MYVFTLVMILYGFPETEWHHIHPDEMQRELSQGSKSPIKDKGMVQTVDVDGFETKNSPPKLSHHTQAPTPPIDTYLGKGTLSKGQFMFFQPNAHPIKSLLLDFWIPWKIFAYPPCLRPSALSFLPCLPRPSI